MSDQAAVKAYFESGYPDRDSWIAPVFRSQETVRAEIIAAWLPPLGGKTVCDVGCGDGRQIGRILSGRDAPSRLTLNDISASAVRQAKQSLTGFGGRLAESIGDAFADGFGGPHDVVIATGVTDYYGDWDGLLRVLTSGASELLIVDFPRKWKLRNLPRKAWLRHNGLQLTTASRRDVCELVSRHARSFEVASSAYNWMARLEI